MNGRAPGYLASFDSAAAMVRATARYLRGEDFPALGLSPAFLLEPLAKSVNLLPERIREGVYALSGGISATSANKLDRVSAEEIARWMVGEYPARKYPGIMLGSSNGAAVHLAAALGMPFLPQTVLIPVRRFGVRPDDMREDLERAKGPARKLLDANPELQLYHMHDPNQDHLMIRYMMYFRVKWRRLGEAYARFITDSLSPGATIFLVDCEKRWPSTQVEERHIFQPGAVGGLTPEEYLHGGERVAEFLARYGSHRRSWDPPEPDGERPEAEWGFEPMLREDIQRLAEEKGYRIRRIAFREPEDLSPIVADLYRWWYGRRRIEENRLLGESFIVIEPWWTLRTGSVPFWTKFGVEASAEALKSYLDSADPFDEINLMLFSHGTESAGLASIERWRSLLRRARKHGRFIGVDEQKYPKDFGVFGRYHSEVQTIPARHPMPAPLSLEQLDAFLNEAGDRYPVEWIEHIPGRLRDERHPQSRSGEAA